MRALIQRVKHASVTVNDEIVGKIEQGLLILLGIKSGDTEKDIDHLVEKISNLRIFGDEASTQSTFEKSLLDIEGDVLIVSQFTLYGSTKKGRRPSFTEAAQPEEAKKLYETFIEKFKQTSLKVETGTFAAMMDVELLNTGPVTMIIET